MSEPQHEAPVVKQPPVQPDIIDLEPIAKRRSRGFWIDAWRRLRRNKLALVGSSVILLNIVLALLAPVITPYTYAEQNHDAFSTAPRWVLDLFGMKPINHERWTFEGTAGDVVTITMDVTTQPGKQPMLSTLKLRGPDGKLLREGIRPPAVVGQPQSTALAITDFELPATGTYTIEPDRTEAGERGDYTISVRTQETPASETTVPCTTEETGPRLCGDLKYGETGTSAYTLGGYTELNEDYFLGTDNRGRDLLSRIIYGARVSLVVAFIGPFVSLIVGISLGLLSGYAGGWVDNLVMRIVDTMYAFPTILLIILMMAYFRAESEPGTFAAKLNSFDARFGGMLFIFIGIGLTSWMTTARLTRGQVLSVREMEYVEAARSIGVSRQGIVWRHIFPNIIGPIIVAETLTIPTYISYEAFLSFIGLGVNRPTPSWGSMISDGADGFATYPYQAIFPALALFFIMFAFNFLGDGLRDALDPRTRES